jgi:hypothetical protein
MKDRNTSRITRPAKSLFHSRGITYFDRRTERSFFFVLTLIMLAWGIIEKLGNL